MAVHIASSCDELIWHSATPLLPAKHMAPLTLHPPSDPAWELLRDMHGGWRTQVAFCFALPDRPTFSFSMPDSPSLSLSLLLFTALNFLLFRAHTNSHSGQCVSLADRLSWCPFGLFCCSRGICINIWPFLALPWAVQHKKLFLFIRTIFRKENKFRVKNEWLTVSNTHWGQTTGVLQSMFAMASLSTYTSSSDSKVATYYHFTVYFTIWTLWCTEEPFICPFSSESRMAWMVNIHYALIEHGQKNCKEVQD